ncbi:MAG: magnesium transporter [Pseudomonadota bacterium]
MANHADSGMEEHEDAYLLDADTITSILDAVEEGNRGKLLRRLDKMHAADIADLLEQIPDKKRTALVTLWGKKFDGEVLAEMDENLSSDLIEELPDEIVAGALKDLETDDVVDLIEDLDEDQKETILDALADSDEAAIRQALDYPEGSAGRLMQREIVMAPTHWTIGQAIDMLRADTDLPESFYDILVVNPKSQPIGKVPLHNLLSEPRETPLRDVMDDAFRTIPVMQTEEDVAYAFNQYNMISAPVVDEHDRLVGVITIDDAMEVLEEQADEDIKRLSGLGDESLTDKILEITKRRFPWLGINLITSILASIVIAQFAGTIEAIVALAVLMPIVASMGGNAGTQTLTVAVRALATKDLTPANAWRVIIREGLVGILNGLIFAVIIGAVGYIWFGDVMLGVVLGIAMIVNLFVAGLAGIFVPLVLDRFGYDPALGSSAFVTTVTDVVGFFAFLGLAAAVLL